MSNANVELARTSLDAYLRRRDEDGGSGSDDVLAGVLAALIEIVGPSRR